MRRDGPGGERQVEGPRLLDEPAPALPTPPREQALTWGSPDLRPEFPLAAVDLWQLTYAL